MLLEIELTKGYVAIVDEPDYELISSYKWTASVKPHTVYAYRKENGKTRYMHMDIMKYAFPYECDHIDGNGLNNSRNNLRIVSHRTNSQNMHPRKRTILHPPGIVYFKNRSRPWQARILVDGVRYSLGRFKTQDEAYAAYCNATKRVDERCY